MCFCGFDFLIRHYILIYFGILVFTRNMYVENNMYLNCINKLDLSWFCSVFGYDILIIIILMILLWIYMVQIYERLLRR